jgi:RHS repeat-associated protein
VRRKVGSNETWQIYGINGELVAEYAPSAAATSPQKEYGYRNGQLLITADAPTTQTGQTQNVEWTSAVGVSVSGNSLTKTAATVWGNAGAASTQTLTSGDGYVEMTVGEAGHARIFGFSHTDTNQNWDTIDFGFHCSNHADNAIYVYESGTERGTFGAYAVGDKLRVSIVGGVVKYSKNGTVFYTSAVSPAYPLRVDAALYDTGATLMSGVVSGNLSSGASGGSSSNIQWLVTDQLGTPRMVFDKTGSLANMKRHDYLPFGEELAGQSGRSQTQGYNVTDGLRQKFTSEERDIETGLDYFGARYFSSTQGRFTSYDPILLSAHKTNPQSWNRYTYVFNDPLELVDPNGLEGGDPQDAERTRQERPIEITDTPINTEMLFRHLEPLIPTPEEAALIQGENQLHGTLTAAQVTVANQAIQDAAGMVSNQPGVVNPCRDALSTFGGADPSAALQALHTAGGALAMTSYGVQNGPQNVFNGSNSTATGQVDGQIVIISAFLSDHPSYAVTVGPRIYLDNSFFNESRIERAQTMIHEADAHMANHRTDAEFAPNRSRDPVVDGSRRISEIIRAGCNRLPR